MSCLATTDNSDGVVGTTLRNKRALGINIWPGEKRKEWEIYSTHGNNDTHLTQAHLKGCPLVADETQVAFPWLSSQITQSSSTYCDLIIRIADAIVKPKLDL